MGANWLYNRIKTIKREIERHPPTVLRNAPYNRSLHCAIDLCPIDYRLTANHRFFSPNWFHRINCVIRLLLIVALDIANK